jgi:hypothetical protein
MRRVIAVTFLTAALGAAAAEGPVYKVIVNAANAVSSARRDSVTQLFLTAKARWANGVEAQPVDQSMTSSVRAAFSREVLGRTPAAVENYWRSRMIAAREFPPMVKESDAEVIKHVAKYEGGIGYVSASAELPDTVKEIAILDALR